MSNLKPITIIGGGLAGLTLGIGLRRLQVPVTIWEASHYPRHRVCGEFVSGRGLDTLRKLGLFELFTRAGAAFARSAGLFLGTAASPVRELNPPALALSRFTMDRLLAEHFRALGGELREGTRWEGDSSGEGLVLANGRRAHAVEYGWRWFGLKIHARRVQLDSDLEMHGSGSGYVGLCRLPGGEVNVCGLFRARPGSPPLAPKELLRGVPGSFLHGRLANASFDEDSFCSVAALPLRPQRALEQTNCRVGDALTMIPPVTGNGMSMAFEGAEIVLQPISAYARGESAWQVARCAAAQACDAAFRQRLFFARWLQVMMFSPALHGEFGAWVLRSDWLWNRLFSHTR